MKSNTKTVLHCKRKIYWTYTVNEMMGRLLGFAGIPVFSMCVCDDVFYSIVASALLHHTNRCGRVQHLFPPTFSVLAVTFDHQKYQPQLVFSLMQVAS
jgi:hypothetical protein